MDAPTGRPSLSEKAKGKQRETDHHNDNGSGTSSSVRIDIDPSKPRSLAIRFNEGLHDLALVVYPKDTVRDVKSKIRVERPTLHNRRLRLIHSGRLLTDGTLIHGWLFSLETRQNRAKGGDDPSNVDAPSNSSTTWIHCSIGPVMDENEQETVQQTQLTPLRGFDRLATAGFTPEDIATIRTQFHTSRGGNNDPLSTEDADEHARALEEQWIDDMDGPGNAALGPIDGDGVYTDLLQGVTTGFFFGFLPFFFMRQMPPPAFYPDEYDQIERIPSAVFSKRMQMAIVIGFLVNFLLGLMKYVS